MAEAVAVEKGPVAVLVPDCEGENCGEPLGVPVPTGDPDIAAVAVVEAVEKPLKVPLKDAEALAVLRGVPDGNIGDEDPKGEAVLRSVGEEHAVAAAEPVGEGESPGDFVSAAAVSDWRGVAVTQSEATGEAEPEAELAGERDMGGEADAVGGAESDAEEVTDDAVVPLGTLDGEGVSLAVAEKALEPLGDGEALGDDHGDGVALPDVERSLERDGASVSDESAVADAPEDAETAAVEVGGALLAETRGDAVASEDDGEGLREKSVEAENPGEPVEVEEGVDSADGGGERVGKNAVLEGGALIVCPALIECAAELEALTRGEAEAVPL